MLKAQFKHFAVIITCVIFVTLVMFSCFNVFIGAVPAEGATQANKWAKVNIPAEGEAGGWVLADGSDIRLLTAAPDGTLYAYGAGLNYTLLKSTNGGLKWSAIGKVQGCITAIAAAANNPGIIYYSTNTSVYRSANGGKNFSLLPAVPGTGTANIEITSIAADSGMIAASTRNTAGAHFGGVYLLDETSIVPTWTDTEIGNYDVYTVAFPPDFTTYRQIIAIGTDEIDSFVFSKISGSGWNSFAGPARLSWNNTGAPVAITKTADIVFPGDYSAVSNGAERSFYAAINTGTGHGGVYRIDYIDATSESVAVDLKAGSLVGNTNTDITSVAVYNENGNTTILTGAADGQTFFSADGGLTWTKNRKAPTGAADAYVLFLPDFPATRTMYAATSGAGSALSVSRDTGITWNQISMVDSSIANLVDLALSPDYGRDNTLFLVTFGNGPDTAALWKTADGSLNWERIFGGDNPAVDAISRVTLPPQYGTDYPVLFLAGESGGNPVIWSSGDNGQSFRIRNTHDPISGTAFTVDAWAAADKNTLFIASHDSTQGLIYRTINSGLFYSAGAPAGGTSFTSIALSPDYDNDKSILAGNSDGEIYQSKDAGVSYELLPSATATGALSGGIYAEYDPDFKNNSYIYASSDSPGAGLYRFKAGKSEDWQSIDTTLPANGVVVSYALAGGGQLSALNSHTNGGLERCLDSKAADPVFETVTRGLSAGATLYNVCRAGNRLWAIDTTNCKLMTYEDTLTAPVIQKSPENNTAGIGSLTDHSIKNITIDWEPVEDATGYEWQCAVNGDFSNIPAGLQGTATAASVRLPPLEPSEVYTWRVRVNSPALSPWSEKRVFTTSLDTRVIDLKPESPAAGEDGVAVKPVFQWTAILGASAYELLVANDADFNEPVIVKTNEYALPSNAWECDVTLDYDTAYYWKIRAISSGSHSPWSSAGVFTTVTAPVPEKSVLSGLPEARLLGKQDAQMNITPPQNAPVFPPAATPVLPPATIAATPAVSQLSAIPEWLIGGLLVITMLALLIILAVVLKIRRF